ncbi:MAG: hypothetical protein RLY78_2302 [Pseudomonadota bacterium]|jgi:uncharacterized membrane protein YfcA
MTFDWLNTVAGFGVGTLVGLTGVGGGSLMTPILVLLFGVAPAAAVGTDLWFAALTKLVGAGAHHRQGTVDWQVFRRLCAGSLPTALLTLWWLHATGGAATKSGLILQALGGVLLLTALATLFRRQTQALGQRLRARAPDGFKRAQPAMTVVAGAILGLLVTLTSVGAGALGVVMLVYLYPFRMTPKVLVGTDIAHAIPLTLVAGMGHLMMGHVDFSLLGALLAGSIPGILIGTRLNARAPEGVLRLAIALVLVAVGAKLLLA